ncbi:lipid II:glycine glycyltransferase FemX [Xylanimonas sp. McL0601]|uniref:lipid II:glycine glycyltransferase FemX n=1 Tax=Xylanimonas sp. McL0601 TaxID=3414739 RepID=UPI003CECCDAF
MREVADRDTWDAAVLALGGHPLQLWGWGEVKSEGDWTAHHLEITADGGGPVGLAQVLVRHLPRPLNALSYVPRGPVVTGGGQGPNGLGTEATREASCRAVIDWCADHVGGVAVTFEPDWPEDTPLGALPARPARNTILYPSTVILDLTHEPEELLRDMHHSARHDIRKSERDGLDIRLVTDVEDVRHVLRVYHETAERAGFALHDDDYYLAIHRELGPHSRVVAAYDEAGEPCCFAWAATSSSTAFQLYAGSNEAGRHLRGMAPVYWASMMDARALGNERYDLNGLLNDGIGEFKRGFAHHEDTLIGTLDVPLSPLYTMWERGLPAAKRIVRRLRPHHERAA